MDGRPHPAGKDLVPSYYGHSIGHWDGDTLIIDTVGFNERAWMNREALPHTDRFHLVEKLTRVDFYTLNYSVTIDDPVAYTSPWTTGFSLQWTPDLELFECICQENNYAPELMSGAEQSADRSSPITRSFNLVGLHFVPLVANSLSGVRRIFSVGAVYDRAFFPESTRYARS